MGPGGIAESKVSHNRRFPSPSYHLLTILSSNPAHWYVPGTGSRTENGRRPDEEECEAYFSPNLVTIGISGPGLPALSLYDLPGLFPNYSTEEEKHYVKVFRNLATHYILHQNAIIICAMGMNNDPGSSLTMALIKELKAENRCVGVITKPDLLQVTHTEYDGLLRKQTYKLDRGYFITKQPGPHFKPRAYEDYHAEARQEENVFFDTDPRWNGVWAEFRGQCGTRNIQEYLSEEFGRKILDRYGSNPHSSVKTKLTSEVCQI